MLSIRKSGFTLLELIVVIIIIGVLATLAIPSFTTMQERSYGKEAIANLKLIAAAEKIYRMERGEYYPLDGATEGEVGDINTDLKLSLPAETYWDYSITTTGNPATTFTATADRQGTATYSDCQYSINQTQEEPVVSSGTCP